MDHGIELQLLDFDFPLLLTFPSFLMKNLIFCFAGMHLTPPIGLFGGKGHILFTAYHLLKNSEYEPSGIADNTCNMRQCQHWGFFTFFDGGQRKKSEQRSFSPM